MAGVRWVLGCVAALGLLAGTAAVADVKAGADAWSRGDYPAAVKAWEGPAAKGDPDAEFNLAQAYRLGRGTQRDLAKAEVLFGKAAAQGHIQAADNYGLLLFDRGQRAQAMPYVQAAADRGDPRAQYLIGLAHFNGEFAPKDWTRAYALVTLAQAAGLPQAAPALAQMDQYIPLPQRQAAATLATQLAQQAEQARASQIASADLGVTRGSRTANVTRPAAMPSVPPIVTGRTTAPPIVHPDAAVPSAVRTAGNTSPATAGADYARPANPAVPPKLAAAPKPPVTPKPPVVPKPGIAQAAALPASAPARTGSWRAQLGAFGVAANADALWAKVSRRPELAGHSRINVKAGSVIKLQAAGFASRTEAGAACAALAKAGYTCVPVPG